MESKGLKRLALEPSDDHDSCISKKKNHDSCLFLLLRECFSRFLPIFSQIYSILSLMASIIIKLPLWKGNFNNNQGIIIVWSPDYQVHTTSSLILVQQNSFITHHYFLFKSSWNQSKSIIHNCTWSNSIM